jgi:drug/metabolite transporter (DMT)-like permease
VGAWSLSPLLIYESRGIAGAPILALYAVTIGSLVALVGVIVFARAPVRSVGELPNRRQWLGEAALLGLAAFVVYPLLYFSAIQHGPPATVNLVNYLWPVVGVIGVAAVRPADRSLELGLAAAFGFAGAGLAIGTRSELAPDQAELYPFALAALAALVYGGVSAAINLRHPVQRDDSSRLFIAALLFGGAVSLLLIGTLGVVQPDLIVFDPTGHRIGALAAYSVLLPVAHISWMLAVRDRRVPAFSTAFLVPVFSTVVLGLVLTGVARPEVLSALVLVLCGILFANVRERGVPVGYAVGLAFLSSVQVSQVLPELTTLEVGQGVGTLSELIAAITAIFAGFVLSNAIQRNGALHVACSRFYARAAALAKTERMDPVLAELDMLDATVIYGVAEPSPATKEGELKLDGEFASEWAEVDVAASNCVSNYEWLVLLIGGGSLILALHAFSATSSSAPVITLRALAVALVVGILFAVRDYDRHRPQRLCELLTSFRLRYGFPVGPPLAAGTRYWSGKSSLVIRFGLVLLVLVAILAIVLNG